MDDKQVRLECLRLAFENSEHPKIDTMISKANKLYNFVIGKTIKEDK